MSDQNEILVLQKEEINKLKKINERLIARAEIIGLIETHMMDIASPDRTGDKWEADAGGILIKDQLLSIAVRTLSYKLEEQQHG